MEYSDDIEALSNLGWGPDQLDSLGRMGMPEGALAQFVAFEPEIRRLVLRIIQEGASGNVSQQTWAELDAYPGRQALSAWLLTLPAFLGDD